VTHILVEVPLSLFRLDASIMPATSQSRALADVVESEWTAAHPDSAITRRDIGTAPVPATAWAGALTGARTPEAERTPEQTEGLALATELADELIAADAILLAIPLYNWGVSQHVKAWYDLTYTDQRIKDGVLKGKPVVLASVLGGDYSEQSGKAHWDHSTPWLRHVLGTIWGADLLVVQRQLTLVGVNPALDALTEVAAEVRAAAELLAGEHGRALAAKR
jgi:FMN-dependent NADH-azoreductase